MKLVKFSSAIAVDVSNGIRKVYERKVKYVNSNDGCDFIEKNQVYVDVDGTSHKSDFTLDETIKLLSA